jgi:phenylacetate-CoA ligase
MSRLEQLYSYLPKVAQELAISLHGYTLQRRRYGGRFDELLELVEGRQLLQGARLKALQDQRLARFLSQAAGAPFWRNRFRQHGVDSGGDCPRTELSKLPILNRDEVQRCAEEITPISTRASPSVPLHTSGTTGSALVFRCTRAAEMEQWAIWWRYRGWHGISRDSRCGYFGGRNVVPLEQDQSPFWRYNRAASQVMFSAYHLSEKNAAAYVEGLWEYSPTWLHGYPSALSLLSRLILDQNLTVPPSVRIVTTGAESLLADQRHRIEQAFQVQVRQNYGQAEAVANFSECPHGSVHVDEDFSLVEFVPLGDGDRHRIIGTNWSNPAFPLLRYDTGDLVVLDEGVCPCGSEWRRVIDIDGRIEDSILLPNGRRIGRLDHCFKDLVTIREAQIVQHDVEAITVNVVPGPEYDRLRDEAILRFELRKRLGNAIGIAVEYLESVPRSSSGKLRFVVSTVSKK